MTQRLAGDQLVRSRWSSLGRSSGRGREGGGSVAGGLVHFPELESGRDAVQESTLSRRYARLSSRCCTSAGARWMWPGPRPGRRRIGRTRADSGGSGAASPRCRRRRQRRPASRGAMSPCPHVLSVASARGRRTGGGPDRPGTWGSPGPSSHRAVILWSLFRPVRQEAAPGSPGVHGGTPSGTRGCTRMRGGRRTPSPASPARAARERE